MQRHFCLCARLKTLLKMNNFGWNFNSVRVCIIYICDMRSESETLVNTFASGAKYKRTNKVILLFAGTSR